MRKIENWEEEYKKADEVVSFENLPVAPQICKVVKIEDIADKEYLKVYFDIADGEYKGFFKEKADNLGEWPSQGITYRSYKKSAEKFFMAFIKAIEKSNPNFKWNWDETKLIDKLFVANFGEEEFVWDGERRVKVKCQEIRSLQALRDNKIKPLKIKKLTKEQENELYAVTDTAEELLANNMAKVDDDLPF